MLKMGDSAYALRMRDLFRRIAGNEIERRRPPYKYATVLDIDRANYKARVAYEPGDTVGIIVRMSGIQPKSAGVRVRVEGYSGDRYIADVLGPVYIVT